MQVSYKSDVITPPLLTLAIPTYNRASYLDLCLKRISEEIAALREDLRCLIKVYVSDNASSDDTSSVISQYKALLGEAFESVRNSENIGPDRNIAQCYDSCITPYVWIIGDDDVILPGGLGCVLDVLLGGAIDILYVNKFGFKDRYSDKFIQKERCGFLRFDNPLEFSRRTNVLLTFISGMIVRRGAGLKYRSELMASNLVQFSWVLPLLREGKRFAIIDDYVIAAKESNSGGYGLVNVFGTNLKKITDRFLEGQPKVARAIQNGAIVIFFPGFVLEFRKGSSKFTDSEMKVGLAEAFGDNWRYYVFLAPLIILPLWLSKYYYYFTRILRLAFGRYLV